MKDKYMVFAYFRYRALGGSHDLEFTTNEYSLAINRAKELFDEGLDVVEVFSVAEEKIIKKYEKELD